MNFKNIRVIPSLLLKKGRFVKGKHFQNHIDAGDPVKTCVAHNSQFADELIIVDLDAYEKNLRPNITLLEKIISEINTPVAFGGNIDNLEIAEKIIRSGADKLLINSNLSNEKLIKNISLIFGRQAIVACIDLIRIEDEYKVYIRGKILKDSFTEYFKNVLKKEIGEIKITFVNLEGSRKGIDIDFAKKLLSTSNVPIIFEGGLSNLSDIEKAITAGIESIALGTMLVFSDNNIFKIKQFLQNRNIPVRLRD
jgi:cyclase